MGKKETSGHYSIAAMSNIYAAPAGNYDVPVSTALPTTRQPGEYDVPAITNKSDSMGPTPPQQTTVDQNGNLQEVTIYSRASEIFKEKKAIVDQKLLDIDDQRIRLISQIVNSVIGGMIMLEGILEMLVIDTECMAQNIWLTIFGALFVLSSLGRGPIDNLLRTGMDFLYRPGFRGFFLFYMGTLQFTWWYGIVTGIFCFFCSIFNYYVMKTHPYYFEEEMSSADQYNQQQGGQQHAAMGGQDGQFHATQATDSADF